MLLCLSLFGSRPSEGGEIEWQLAQEEEAASRWLRWQNVAPGDRWVSGKQPVYRWSKGCYAVHLGRGESTVVELHPGERLALYAWAAQLHSAQYRLWRSNGSGVFARASWSPQSPQDCLLYRPQEWSSQFIEIQRTEEGERSPEIGLFVLKRAAVPGGPSSFRDLLLPGRPCVEIRESWQSSGSTYFRLTDRPLRIPVHGVSRLALATRLKYGSSESRVIQRYSLTVSGAAGLSKTVDLDTRVEFSRHIFVDGSQEIVGQERTAYLTIPHGIGEVSLVASAEVYCRILEEKRGTYLFPRLNGPVRTDPRELASRVREIRDSLMPDWAASAGISRTGGLEETAKRMAVRNDFLESGNAAAQVMRKAAESFGDAAAISKLAERLTRYWGRYVDLVPEEKKSNDDQLYMWFTFDKIATGGQRSRRYVVGEQHLTDLVRRMGKGLFTAVPRSRADGQTYLLPRRLRRGRIRLAVYHENQGEGGRLFAQFDTQSPLELRLVSWEKPHRGDLQRSLGEAGLEVARWLAGDLGGLGSPGRAAWQRTIGPVVNVAVVELAVPPGVGKLKVWREADALRRVRLAAQYRVTGDYQPSETEYLAALREVEKGFGVWNWLQESLAQYDRGWGPASNPEQLLRNQWFPLIRASREEDRKFASFAVSRGRRRRGTRAVAGGEESPPLLRAAREAEIRGDWFSALEKWSQVLRVAEGREKEIAELGRVRSLRELDAFRVAEKILKELISSPLSEHFQKECVEYLAELYEERDDRLALERLRLAAFSMQPDYENARELLGSLMESGEYSFALLLSLALPESHRAPEPLLRSALRNEWWGTFDREVERLTDRGASAFWIGLKYIAKERYAEAVSILEKAGEPGEVYRRLISEALSIREEIRSVNRAVRSRGILRWEEWVRKLPGPYVWFEDKSLIREYAGTVALYSEIRNRRAVYYRAAAGRPVKIRVLGPARLRIEIRPLYREDETGAPDGWLEITDGEWVRHVPIRSSVMAGDLTVIGREDLRPGRRRFVEMIVGIGVHEYRLSEMDIPLMVRAFVRRPEFPLAILPPFCPLTVRAAFDGRLVREERRVGSAEEEERLRILTETRVARAVDIPFRKAPRRLPDPAPPDLSGLETDLARKLAIRLGEKPGDCYSSPEQDLVATDLSAAEKIYLLGAAGKLGEAVENPARYDGVEIPEDIKVGVLLRHGRLSTLMNLPMGDEPEDVLRRIEELAFIAEQIPEYRRYSLCQGERLYLAGLNTPAIRSAYARLTGKSVWRKVPHTAGGAGLRYLDVKGWAPEKKSLRILKALLPELSDHEQVIVGSTRLVLAVSSRRSKFLRLVCSVDRLGLAAALPVTVVCQLDEEEPVSVQLTERDSRRIVNLALPPGEHHVKVWTAGHGTHRYVRVGFLEAYEANKSEVGEGGVPIARRFQREYVVATADRPVVFEIDGPAWLRIDEFRDGATLTEYRYVGEETETVTLAPAGDREEGLYRVFEKVEGAHSPCEPVKEEPRRVEPLKELPAEEADAGREERSSEGRRVFDFSGEVGPGGLRLGTWSYAGRFARKRALEEDSQGFPTPDQYFEMRATHRFRKRALNARFRTSLLGRVHDEGGPTVGITERIRIELPDWWGLSLDGDARFFLQWPHASGLEAEGSAEWSGTLRGRISKRREVTERLAHRPAIDVFGRTLSVAEGNPEDLLITDQDVFTTYKQLHRAGVVLSEAVYYKPWMDSRVAVKVSLSSNEDFNIVRPDNAALRIGFAQRFGSAQLDAGFRVAHFFEDGDRSRDFRRHVFSLRGLQDFWLRPSTRIELVGEWSIDIERADSSFLVGVVFHLGDTRGYRDFGPDELSFRELRERSMYRSLARTDRDPRR